MDHFTKQRLKAKLPVLAGTAVLLAGAAVLNLLR